MLESIRKYANNIIFKILFGLLILAFAVSGIAGLTMGSFSDDYVAKIGSHKITQLEVDKRFNQLVTSLGPQAAGLTEEQLAGYGVSRQQVFQTLVQGAFVAQEVKDIGIEIGDESIEQQIARMPVFKDESGKFSQDRFKTFLSKMNFTEAEFKDDIRKDLQNLVLASSVLNNTPKNIFVAEEIARAVNVKRDIEIIKIPAGHIKVDVNPTDQELNDFYFENAARYQLPERRDITLVKIPKPKAEDKEGYNNIGKIEDEIAGGSTLAEISKKYNLESAPIKNVVKGNNSKIIETIFATAKGKVSNLVEDNNGGFLIVQVDSVYESGLPDITGIKPAVIADYKAKKQLDENIRFAQNILAQLPGQNFSQMAAQNGLAYEAIPGFTSEDKRFGDEFIATIFGTAAGQNTAAIPDGKGSYNIAKVTALHQVDVDAEQINTALKEGAPIFQQELFDQYLKYLQKKYPLKQKEPKQEKPAKLAKPAKTAG
jgi:hypothetical protein